MWCEQLEDRITPSGLPPFAFNDSYSVVHDRTLSVSSPGVLSNDTDPEHDALTAVLVSGPAHGSLTLNSNGSFSYTPSSGYTGSDGFQYKANDGTSNSLSAATVTISVTNTLPVGVADSYSGSHDRTLSVSAGSGVLANDTDADGDTLTASLVGGVSHGSLTLNSNGSFSYTPTAGYTGSDSFTYKANDGIGNSGTTTVSLSVTNATPVANNDTYVLHNGSLSISSPGVLSNDTDADGDTLTASLVSGVSHGSLTLNSNGSFSYTPGGGFTGSDSFTYKASDGIANSSNATVTINAPTLSWSGTPTGTWSSSPVSPPTVTTPSDQSKAEGDSVSLSISASDPNSYTLSYTADNLPDGLSINSSSGAITGTVGYDAAENFDGSYTSTVIVTNDHGASTSVSFGWTISDTPRVPVVTTPSDQTNAAGDTVSLSITASQPDSDPLFYDTDGLPSGLTIDNDSGVISGTIDPSAASNTAYSVTVSVTDYVPATPQTTTTTFNWTVGAPTPGPALDTIANQTNAAGDYVDLPLSATDSGGYPLTYVVSGLPAGLSADPSSGAISGTIANSAASGTPYSVTALVSDGQTSASQTFTWTVGAVSLTNPGDQANLDSDTVSVAVTAADAGSSTLTYSLTGQPSGLSIDSSTGVISGTLGSSAHTSSPYSVTVTASDGTYSNSAAFSWIVDRVALDNPGDQQALEGTSRVAVADRYRLRRHAHVQRHRPAQRPEHQLLDGRHHRHTR